MKTKTPKCNGIVIRTWTTRTQCDTTQKKLHAYRGKHYCSTHLKTEKQYNGEVA